MAMRFEQLIERHHEEIFAYLWRLMGKVTSEDGAADVEDLAQEVFLKAYQSFGRLREQSNHRAWLYKIATNCAYTSLRERRNKRGKTLRLDDAWSEQMLASDLAFGPVARNQSAQRARALVENLPVKQKTALVLRYLQELDYGEIASVMGCSQGSARANVYQALRRLRATLKEES
jgi:RNA polymerase sigma-70 factor (ECF subfamily)